jgi:putative transposase
MSYKAYLDEGTLSQIREAINGNYVLGNARFRAEIARMLGRRVTKEKAGRPSSKSNQSDKPLKLPGEPI